jgi:transposase-like protein
LHGRPYSDELLLHITVSRPLSVGFGGSGPEHHRGSMKSIRQDLSDFDQTPGLPQIHAMPKSYSGDLRERVIESVETGASRREAAEHIGVSASSAVRWLQRWDESRSAAPSPRAKPFALSGWPEIEQGPLTATKRAQA